MPWAVIYPTGGPIPRHPSQIYEALLEGVLLFLVLAWAFWKTDARYQPGKLVGLFLLGYGLSRFFVEFFREADEQLMKNTHNTHHQKKQKQTQPMIIGGIWLIATAKGRRQRVESNAGQESVA